MQPYFTELVTPNGQFEIVVHFLKNLVTNEMTEFNTRMKPWQ